MSVPIQSTPILRGKDLVDLVNDLKKTDTPANKERRRRALKLLEAVSKEEK
ncbi:MAG TPA: hypothetical protein VMW83_09015 [Spirochaetia bacterium]|nr:hypothetical protein [Spirochaetia bacterium]